MEKRRQSHHAENTPHLHTSDDLTMYLLRLAYTLGLAHSRSNLVIHRLGSIHSELHSLLLTLTLARSPTGTPTHTLTLTSYLVDDLGNLRHIWASHQSR